MDTIAHRLALLTSAATFLLILAGGLVTNTGAGLAVPDWPSTFGHNMFLYPWSAMVGGIFYEHSHRLLGAAVGMLTIGLCAALWRLGGRLRMLGLVALGGVVIQGILGGLRVVLREDVLGLVHGCVAQAFFALLILIAVRTSSGVTRRPIAPNVAASLRTLTIVAAALVYGQIALGALLTHLGWLELHLAGAFAVFTLMPIASARLRRSGHARLRVASHVILLLLAVQLMLGVGSFLARFSSIWLPGGQFSVIALPVMHRLVGSLILAATVASAVMVTGGTPRRWATSAGSLAPAPGPTS